MGRDVLSETSYRKVAEEATRAGSATFAGEQRRRQGLGLHPLVDPSGYEVIRRSLTWYEPEGDHFTLLRGVAMLEESRLDTTGSMGNNVSIAMRVLPTTYKLLATSKQPVLGRYDVQMITSIFGDVVDQYILCRSQAEMDERIAEQMTLMVPEGNGGDGTEDSQYGIFGGAYLTQNSVNDYGLKSYDYTITDAPSRKIIVPRELVRVYGENVYTHLKENGFQFTERSLPDLNQTVRDLQKRAHAFVLCVGRGYREFWTDLYGSEYVITLPSVDLLPQVKAAIIGLTEGVLDLQTVEDYLMESSIVETEGILRGQLRNKASLNRQTAREIRDSVAHIPIGAQAALPNFDKIPLKGAKFAKKGDLWPIGEGSTTGTAKGAKKPKAGAGGKKDSMWL